MTALSRDTASRRSRALRRLMLSSAASAALAGIAPAGAQTLPVPVTLDGATVSSFDPDGNVGFGLRVNLNDQNRVLNWLSFDVGTAASSAEQVDFTTAAATPLAVLNRVVLGNPSEIFGRITSKSNVTVWLVNPSGITFGNTGGFSGGSLILSTAQQNLPSIPAFDTAFKAGNQPLNLRNHPGAASIVLAAGSGALQTAGPIVVIAQKITASKAMTSTGSDVALVAASDVVVPTAFGSPLGITITQGTTVATARIDANGAIDAANVRLYGASASNPTAALLNVGTAAVLTATAVDGKVVLAAGSAAAGTDLSFAGAPAGDIDGIATIAQGGTLRATGAGGDVLLATNGAIGGGGDLLATLGGVTLIAPVNRAVVVGDIAATDGFTLATQANITTGAITVTGGFIDLETTVAGSIQTGALAAFDRVRVDAFAAATVASAAAGVANPIAPSPPTTVDVAISATNDLNVGAAIGPRDILLTSSAGNVVTTGDLVAGRTVAIDAALTATVGRGVNAGTGNYIVDGAAVALGTTDAIPVTQQAGGFIEIAADTTSISGRGALTIRSNRDGLTGARYLQLSAATAIDFADTTLLAGGPANQSVLALLAGSTIRLGGVAARRIAPVADFSLPFSTIGDFSATDVTVADDLSITSDTGSIRIGQATSQLGDIALTATAGDVTGLVGAADTGPLDPGFGRADLTASAANRVIAVTAFGTAQLGTLTAGTGVTALNNNQIDVRGTAASLVRGVATNGDLRVVASADDATLGSIDVRRNVTVDAAGAAAVRGGVIAGGFYTVRGTSVTLGDGTTATQAARGSVDITATAGAVTGNTGLTLQSNSGGQADAGNTRFLRLTATGDAIDFAPTSQLLGGTAGQSVLALNGTSATPANDATTIDLGIVRARSITASDLAATGFVTAGDFTAVDSVTRDTLDITSTAGSIRIGSATSQTGNIALTTTNASALTGDITGLISGGGFGRATLTASAANTTIIVRAINAAHLVQLGTVTAGAGTGSVALDQISLEGGVLDVTQAIARNGGLLAQSTTGDVILGGGSSARVGATVEAQGNARLGGLTSIAGLVDVRTATGDVTGLASGGGFARADLTATFASGSVSVIAAGAVTLGTLAAGQNVTVRAGSAITPSDGAIDLVSVTTTNGDVMLDAFSADLTAPLRNGDVTLGSAIAGGDGTIAASGDIRLTDATTGRHLTLAAGTAGVSSDSAAIVNGTVAAGTAGLTGFYRVTGSRVDLQGTQSAQGSVDIFAYGTGAGDGITGGSGLTLMSSRVAFGVDNPLLLRADGGAGIAFAADSTLLGGASGESDDIGIFGPLASLRLGNVRARSLQGLNAVTPDFGALATPNPVTVIGNIELNNTATVRGALSILSQTGDITTRAITVGTFFDDDRSLTLTATNGAITANNALLAFGDVTLDALNDIRIANITTSPLLSATPTLGDISIASVQGNVTGLADTLAALAPFGIGTIDATGGGVTLNLPGNAAIGTIDAQGLIDLDGSDIRLDRATSRGGAIDITASGALTGTASGFAGVGTVSADLAARGSIRVTAGGAGTPRAVNLRDLTAGTNITVEAGRIALASATATTGALTLIAGSTLALGSGVAGTLIDISSTGVTGAPALVSDFAAGVLDTNFGSTNLFTDADGQTIRVAAGTIAQLGDVRAGALASSGAFRQIDVSAGALTAATLTARNGDIFAITGPGIAPTIGSPLYVGTITTTNGVELRKTGDNALAHDELRIGSITAALGDILLFSDASARLGTITATIGSVSATAQADLTGLILPAPTGTAPDPAFALLGIVAGRDIALDAGNDLQTGTLTASRDIDATAGSIAWLGGTTTATTGHYRVTGGSVLLGTPGNVAQTAATDVAIRSTSGAITGGSGLVLTSDSGNSGAAANYLVLDSAAGIAFANGLNGDTIATLRGGANGTSADIGIRLAPNATLQLGNVAGRTIGSATGPSGVPALYAVAPILMTRGAISARDITVASDLAIDNVTSGSDITLDTGRSTGGGINIATAGNLTGRAIDPILAPGVFARTNLTAARGIETLSGFALFGTVDAGTAIALATSSNRLDATNVIARAGDLRLNSASHLRVDTVTASGDGTGMAPAQMLASAILPSAALTTAGDIGATALRDVTDTALGGSSRFVSITGGVALTSNAATAGEGTILADLVYANGTTAGHRDVAITGRRIAIGTRVESTGGDATIAATESGAQTDVSVTAPLVTAFGNVSISAGFGTGLVPGADNGSLRVGSVTATTGSITLAALDGNITGSSGSTDGLDPLHDRIALTAGSTITARSGGLTSVGVATGDAVRIEAGDVTQAGARADNGAIDATRIATTGDLTLIARAATATGGFTGDIRVGATAAGQPAPGIAATTGGTALLETQGVRGDVTVASALVTIGDLTIRSIANARLAGGDATPFTTHFLASTGGNIATIAGADVTGLRIPGTLDNTLASFGRADLTTGGSGTITLTAGGTLQLGTVTAGTIGQPDIADQIVATAEAIDLTTAIANNGNLSLTSTLGDIRLGVGEAQVDARLDSAANARLGTVLTRTGNIQVTARGGDVTGLPDVSGFARAVVATQGTGMITVDAANGMALLGPVTAGSVGANTPADQIVVTARAIDITTATANNGNLSLTSTLGDIRLDTGEAQVDARIDAAANARLGTVLTRTGNITVIAGTDVTGLPEASGFGRTDLTTGGVGTITLTAGGTLQLGTVTAGTIGAPAIADQIIATAQAIDLTTAIANNGNLSLTSTLGDIRLDAGDAQVDATIDSAANVRLGTLLTRTGNINVSAGADVTGLPIASVFGRADLATQGTGAIVVDAGGTALLGPVTAGIIGTSTPADQIVVTAQAIDITTATANTGNLSLTSTLGDVRIETGAAQNGATIDAAGSARINTLTTQTGNIAIGAGADVSGLRIAGIAETDLTNFGRADLTTGGTGTITLTAGGALQLGTVTAGTVGGAAIADQIIATAGAIVLTTATANNGNLSLTSTLGDIRLDSGDARANVTIDAAANARLGTVLTRTGNIQVTARGGDVTGLPDVSGFTRADLATQGTGTITVDAANGMALLGPVTAGSVGANTPGDQIIVTAQAIDITTATANNGNLSLTSTLNDVRIETGTAQVGATIDAAGSARIGTLTTQTGNIAITAGVDVTGLAPISGVSGFARTDLTTGATGTITLTANSGALLLGTVTAGISGQPDIGEQIVATAQAIDLTTATANNGNLALTTFRDMRIETGAARGDTIIAAGRSARIGTLTTQTGDIAITAGADVSGLRIAGIAQTDLANFGRAVLTTGGVGTITLSAGGALQLGSVIAGSAGRPDIGDQIVATAQAIDLTTATANNGNLALTSTLGEVRLDTGSARIGATIDAATSARIGTLDAASGNIQITARGGDVTGLSDATGFGRADLTTSGTGAIIVGAANGTALLGPVTAGTPGTDTPSDQIQVMAQAIDITTATANNGNLSLTATLGDVVIETGAAQVGATVVAANNGRIGTLATQTGNIAITAGADVTGLATGTGTDPDLASFGRADLTAGGVGSVALTAANGTLQLGTVTAGTIGQPDIADQIVATAQAIDLTTATANNGNLSLTATLGDVRLDTGDARGGATIDAAANARLGTLLARSGAIRVTARDGDVTGLPDGPGFGRADLATTSGGAIIVSTPNGTARLGSISIGTGGSGPPTDQFVVTASAIDIESATASGGNLSLTATAGDVRLVTGAAQANATITAAGNARIGTLTTQAGNIAVTAGADVTGLVEAAGIGRADLVAGGAGTITLTANTGALRLGTVTAGTVGQADIGNQIIATAQGIDLVDATASNGALVLTSTLGETRLDTGSARTSATIDAAASARIGTLATAAGNIRVTARGGDVTGLPDASGFGRANLATGGVGTITVGTASGAAQLGTVTAGTTGTSTPVDQLVVTGQAIDVAAATASNGNLALTATLGDVRLETGAAQRGTTIVAAGSARIGTLATQAGDVTVTSGADATGLALGTGTDLASFGRADLAAGGTGSIALTTASGTQQLGTVTAADRIVATARAIDITTATASNGSLSLSASADDVRLGTGLARTDATILANRSVAIGALTTQTGKLALTATTGEAQLGTGVANTDATVLAATNAAVGSLTAQTGAITVTATRGNIAGTAGTAATGANFATLAAGKTIALTADVGSATLGTVATVDGAITLTAADATLNGVVGADGATIDILRGAGSTITRIGTLPAATGGLALDDTEMGRLQADTVRIGSRIASPGSATDIAIGGLTIGTATGDTALKFLASGRIALSGAIKDAGAVARTLQIGGNDVALGTTTPVATPLASRIDATIVPGNQGAAIDLPAATIDLRAARVAFGNDSFLGELATTTGTLDDAAAAQVIADDLVANAGSSLYRRNLSRDVFLRAKLLRVSYSGFALFQNTDPSLLGLGVELGLGERSVAAPAVLELRSLGENPANSFALFGTINGFVGRTAGVLPNSVLEFADGSRTIRITQSNSRINGCVIGSPDRGCLITDAPPPLIRIFDQRQLQLFGVADDLTIPFEPSVGSSNEALIGDFTTTGGLIDPDCTVPDATGCPTQGERP